jgi:hypothetical protein
MAKETAKISKPEQRRILKEKREQLNQLKDVLPDLRRAGVDTQKLGQKIKSAQSAINKLEQM